MAKNNHKVIDFLIQIAEDPAKVEEYKVDPKSTFDL